MPPSWCTGAAAIPHICILNLREYELPLQVHSEPFDRPTTGMRVELSWRLWQQAGGRTGGRRGRRGQLARGVQRSCNAHTSHQLAARPAIHVQVSACIRHQSRQHIAHVCKPVSLTWMTRPVLSARCLLLQAPGRECHGQQFVQPRRHRHNSQTTSATAKWRDRLGCCSGRSSNSDGRHRSSQVVTPTHCVANQPGRPDARCRLRW